MNKPYLVLESGLLEHTLTFSNILNRASRNQHSSSAYENRQAMLRLTFDTEVSLIPMGIKQKSATYSNREIQCDQLTFSLEDRELRVESSSFLLLTSDLSFAEHRGQ